MSVLVCDNGDNLVDLNSFFPHKVCINLDRRPERWARMQARFARHGLGPVARFPALDGERIEAPEDWKMTAGAYGCLRSNVSIVEQARKKGWPSVLIFEDDVVFDEDFSARFPDYIKQVPEDWDMIFFGCMYRDEPRKISDNVVKLTGATSTYAYALRNTIYDAFIDFNNRARSPVDVNNVTLQQSFNSYCFRPHLAWVEADYSDTYHSVINPWWLREGLIMCGPQMDRILEKTVAVIPYRNRTAADRRNLTFAVNHYEMFCPAVTVLVVEQDDSPSVDTHNLPPNCRHRLLADAGPFNKGRCFNEGLKMFEFEKDYFIFADKDIRVTWEIKAALNKCQQYQFVSSPEFVFDLSEKDSQKAADRETVDISGYSPRPRADLCGQHCTFTREGIRIVGGWGKAGRERSSERQSRAVGLSLRVFESPGWALRLNTDVDE